MIDQRSSRIRSRSLSRVALAAAFELKELEPLARLSIPDTTSKRVKLCITTGQEEKLFVLDCGFARRSWDRCDTRRARTGKHLC